MLCHLRFHQIHIILWRLVTKTNHLLAVGLEPLFQLTEFFNEFVSCRRRRWCCVSIIAPIKEVFLPMTILFRQSIIAFVLIYHTPFGRSIVDLNLFFFQYINFWGVPLPDLLLFPCTLPFLTIL